MKLAAEKTLELVDNKQHEFQNTKKEQKRMKNDMEVKQAGLESKMNKQEQLATQCRFIFIKLWIFISIKIFVFKYFRKAADEALERSKKPRSFYGWIFGEKLAESRAYKLQEKNIQIQNDNAKANRELKEIIKRIETVDTNVNDLNTGNLISL